MARLTDRGEVFEILYEFKQGDFDIGDAYDQIYNLITKSKKVNTRTRSPKPKRKLSAWNKFVKANSSKKIYKFANGKLKLKKMGIAFRKTPAGRKK